MSDLVEFLRARFDEEEAVALAATSGTWIAIDGGVAAEDHQDDDGYNQWPVAATESGKDRADREHIAQWNPAHVLADVEAKRARVGVAVAILNGSMLGVEPSGDPDIDAAGLMGAQFMAKLMLKIEALPYAQHPEYQQEWAQSS